MESKNYFSLWSFVVFTLLCFSVVSAGTVLNSVSAPTSVDENAGSFTVTFTVTNNGVTPDNYSLSSTANFGSVAFNKSSPFVLANGSSERIMATITNFASRGGTTLALTLNATNSTGSFASSSANIAIKDTIQMCSDGDRGDLRVSDFSVDNLGDGDDEEWFPLDEIEIEFEIENINNDDDVSDVLVEIFIFDENGVDVTDDFDVTDEEIDLGKIKEDDSEMVTFSIPEVPADLDEGNYRIYMKAYSDGDEEIQCASDVPDFNKDGYHEIEYTRDEDTAVIVRNRDLESVLTTTCGQENVIINVPIYNIGDEKEESVLVNLYNKELGIDAYDQVEDLKSGKRTEVSFAVSIPQSAKEGRYKLDIFTFFEYDDDDGDEMDEASYDSNSYEDLDDDFKLQLDVVGCVAPVPTITASLDSEARVGESLVVKSVITNNGDATNVAVAISGVDDWASDVSVMPQAFALAKGESKEIVITMTPTASGFHAFSIDGVVAGKPYAQPVSVNIAEKKGFSFGALDNQTLMYVIIGLVVLIVIIVLVIIFKMAGKRSSDRF